MDERNYSYPVYATQEGGIVRWLFGAYVFLEKPRVPEFRVADTLPEGWIIFPANDLAIEAEGRERF